MARKNGESLHNTSPNRAGPLTLGNKSIFTIDEVWRKIGSRLKARSITPSRIAKTICKVRSGQ